MIPIAGAESDTSLGHLVAMDRYARLHAWTVTVTNLSQIPTTKSLNHVLPFIGISPDGFTHSAKGFCTCANAAPLLGRQVTGHRRH